MREYCGSVKYYGIVFDVFWDVESKAVFVNKSNSKLAVDLSFPEYLAESKQDAEKVALEILKKAFGD